MSTIKRLERDLYIRLTRALKLIFWGVAGLHRFTFAICLPISLGFSSNFPLRTQIFFIKVSKITIFFLLCVYACLFFSEMVLFQIIIWGKREKKNTTLKITREFCFSVRIYRFSDEGWTTDQIIGKLSKIWANWVVISQILTGYKIELLNTCPNYFLQNESFSRIDEVFCTSSALPHSSLRQAAGASWIIFLQSK